MVKNLLVMQQTWVQSLAEEDPLEKEMATRSRILAWKIPWREEPSGATVHGVMESDMTEETEQQQQHDFSHEIKRRFLLGRQAMTNLDAY